MKKTIMLLACILALTLSAVSVSAYNSPEILTDTEHSDSNTDSTKGDTDTLIETDSEGILTDVDSEKKTSDTDNKTSDTDKKTSPKTGTPVSYGILSASAAAMFGCAAVTLKRKIKN